MHVAEINVESPCMSLFLSFPWNHDGFWIEVKMGPWARKAPMEGPDRRRNPVSSCVL